MISKTWILSQKKGSAMEQRQMLIEGGGGGYCSAGEAIAVTAGISLTKEDSSHCATGTDSTQSVGLT